MKTLLTIATLLTVLLAAPGPVSSQPTSEKAEVDVRNRIAPKAERIQRKLNEARTIFSEGIIGPDGRRTMGYDATTYAESIRLLEEAIAIDPRRAKTYFDAAAVVRDIHGGAVNLEAGYLEQYVELANRKDYHWAAANARLGRLVEFITYPDIDLDKAERHYLAAYNAMLEDADVFELGDIELELANISFRRRDYEAAVRFYRAALQHGLPKPNHPSSLELAWMIARAQAFGGEPQKALDELEAWLEEHGMDSPGMLSETVYLYDTFQLLHTQLENYETALQYVDAMEDLLGGPRQMALSTQSPMVMVESARAGIYFEMGEYAEAERHWRKALDLSPSDPTMLNNVAWAVVIQADFNDDSLEEALDFSERAVEMEPNMAHLDTLAEIYFRLYRFEDALETIDEAIELAPTEKYLQEQRAKFVNALNGNPWHGTGHIRTVERWTPPDALGL